MSTAGESPKKAGHSIEHARHSKAKYLNDAHVLASGNPQGPIDVEHQITPDLTPEGIELAEAEAGKLFDKLDPLKDKLFFVSSSQTRAFETAAIYRRVAKERGFTVIPPEHVRNNLPAEVVEGREDIRILQSLSLKLNNTLTTSVFDPDDDRNTVNWDAVPSDVREKWEKAHAIVSADDKGSWGLNFYAHSAAVQEILPEIKSAQDMYEGQFQNLLRLAQFGLAKAAEKESDGSIKILSFGHENYMGVALDKYFSDHKMKNCESIGVELNEQGGLVMERRGVKADVAL